MDTPRHNSDRRVGYLNVVLTAIAVLLTLLVLDGHAARGVSAASSARAQGPGSDDPHASAQALVSASEQRKLMIAELRKIGTRMERIESKLTGVVSVKVTEMPSQKGDGK